ncbi:hypothetical protein AB0C04_08905 [Micromonospora sp. NPDC048909]|uniref:hypothetical protein n=1 Tax=Micromonospora sp. NPDC048909 TaxID=3155643 RepID=UPI00340E0ACE
MSEYAELFYQYEEAQVMDSAAFEARFTLRPTPLADAVTATVDWLRAALAAQV